METHIFIWFGLLALKNRPIEDVNFVEFGTGKGFMMAGLMKYFELSGHQMPAVFLFDTFESKLPGSSTGGMTKNFAYASSIDEVESFFIRYSTVTLMPGLLPESFHAVDLKGKIDFLHVDLNVADTGASCLEAVWAGWPRCGHPARRLRWSVLSRSERSA